MSTYHKFPHHGQHRNSCWGFFGTLAESMPRGKTKKNFSEHKYFIILTIFWYQIHATVAPVLTSPTGLYHAKQMRHPTTEKDQYNQAMVVLKNLADTISSLAAPAFNEKIQLFKDIHTLIKEDKPVQLMVIDASSAKDAITPSSTIDQDPVIDSSSAEDVITTSSEAVLSPTMESKVI